MIPTPMSFAKLHQKLSGLPYVFLKTNVRPWSCNVPDPPTSDEDATMELTIRATSPMNMCIHKTLKQNALKYNMHRYNIIHIGSNIHSCKHSFNMFTTFINRKYDCRSKIDKVTYLIRIRSATNYVPATFHPTIGQRAP